ncbi:MAG: hypothetical protein AVDCRST_MAG88-4307, partial [uncultured Thermomicrobiales bacterium]
MAGEQQAHGAVPKVGDRETDHIVGLTRIPISPRLRTILVLAALALLVLLLRATPGVLTVLLGGATLALVLSFPVRLLARLLPRGL